MNDGCYSKYDYFERSIQVMSSANPKVTIIVAVYNGAKTLQQCIDSIASQSYSNKELIILDGGSTDGTLEILKANQDKLTIWVTEPDEGIYDAWNKGVKQAHGDWICFIGADDYFWDSMVLERVVRQLYNIPSDILFAYGSVSVVNHYGDQLYKLGEPWELLSKRIKKIMCIPQPGSMHRKAYFEKHGLFDTSFRIAGDYELLLRELKLNSAFFLGYDVLVGMRHGGMSSNPETSLNGWREVRQAQLMHGIKILSFPLLFAIMRAYTRMMLWKLLGEAVTRKILDLGRRVRGLPVLWTKT